MVKWLKEFTLRCKDARIRVPRYFVIYLLCFLFQTAQATVYAARAITPTEWQQLTNNKAFGYKNDKEGVQKDKEYKANALQSALTAIFNFFDRGEGLIFVWLIGLGVVLYILYKLFLNKDSFLFGRSEKKMNRGAQSLQEEDDISKTNWETLLQKATGNNDYRLAVRYSYMWLLQMLQQRDLIQYRIDKTNYEYYSELNETNFKQSFKDISRRYEYAWYGRFALSERAFKDYQAVFNNVKKQLGA